MGCSARILFFTDDCLEIDMFNGFMKDVVQVFWDFPEPFMRSYNLI